LEGGWEIVLVWYGWFVGIMVVFCGSDLWLYVEVLMVMVEVLELFVLFVFVVSVEEMEKVLCWIEVEGM